MHCITSRDRSHQALGSHALSWLAFVLLRLLFPALHALHLTPEPHAKCADAATCPCFAANVLSAPGAASTQASSGPAAPVSVPSPSSAQRSGPSAMGRASSLTERFQRAATPDGLVAEPRPKTVGSSSGRAKWGQCDPAMLQLPGVDGEAGDPGAVQQGEDEGLIPAAWGEEREEEEAGPEMDANASARALQQRLEAALDRGVGALLTEASGSEVEGAAEEASAAANAATEVAAAEAAAPEAAAVPAEASGKQALRADARSTSVSSSAAAPRASAGSRRTSSSSTGNGSRRATADGQRGGAAAGAAAGVAAGMAGGSRRESAKQARTSNAVGSRRQTADCQGAQSGDGRSKPPTQSNARAAQKAAVVQQGAPAPKNGAAPQSLKEPKVDTQESQEPGEQLKAIKRAAGSHKPVCVLCLTAWEVVLGERASHVACLRPAAILLERSLPRQCTSPCKR